MSMTSALIRTAPRTVTVVPAATVNRPMLRWSSVNTSPSAGV
jgi:hypothetical protein